MPVVIATRELVLVFILAKGLSLGASFAIVGTDASSSYFSAVAHLVSIAAFVTLMLIATRQSPTGLYHATKPLTPKLGTTALWCVIAFPLGLLFRFGSEGVYLSALQLYDPALALGEFEELVLAYSKPLAAPAAVLALVALVGAVDEELIYRRVFQWHFCSKHGLIKGILLVAVVFGLVHLNPIAALASVCLSCVYLLSGRLWVAVVAHVAGNLFHPLMGWAAFTVSWSDYSMFSMTAALLLGAGLVTALRVLTTHPGFVSGHAIH